MSDLFGSAGMSPAFALRAMQSAAPANCSPADIGGHLDRQFLDVLIAHHEAAMDRARHQAADDAAEIASLRSQLRLAKAALASALVERLEPLLASTQTCADCLLQCDVADMVACPDDALRCAGCVEDIAERRGEGTP